LNEFFYFFLDKKVTKNQGCEKNGYKLCHLT
jgi:hypothetical protein